MKGMMIMLLLSATAAQAAPKINSSFMISFWCAPPRSETTLERYKEIADCGFNVVLPPCDATDLETNRKILDYCKTLGLKAIIADSRIMARQPQDPVFAANLDAVIGDYAGHPALAGYFLTDEPNAGAFPHLGEVSRYLLEKDPDHLPYINLFPNYANKAQLGTKTYEEHVARYIGIVRPPVVSWDHYALFESGERDIYFDNLEIVRRQCLKAGLPFVQIILAIPHGPYRNPDEADFRWQVYTTLAYGAKGVLYFTYWTPHDPAWNFRNAIISEDGKRTEHYEMVRAVNRKVQALAPLLMKLDSAGVYHTDPLPPGTRGLDDQSPVRQAEGGPMVIGWLRDRAQRDYLLIVNRSFKETLNASLSLKGQVKEIYEISQQTGRPRKLTGYSGKEKFKAALPPGEGKLFRLDR
ncbi:MAG: hypothetical protein IT210_16525 [Armatimonadetes bacterium]|nr:hypothetical protein [Armatimonadota bacterium]